MRTNQESVGSVIIAAPMFDQGWLIGQGTLPYALGKNVGETEGMDFSPEPVLIEVVTPDASAASEILRSYIDDVANRSAAVQTSARGGPAQLAEPVDSNLWQGHSAFRCGVAASANGQSPNSAPVTSYPAEAPPATLRVSSVCGAMV